MIKLDDFELIKIPIENLYLDPNNYRILEYEYDIIPTEKITEQEIQNRTFLAIKKEEGWSDLKRSITNTQGLLERLIVIKLTEDKYLVIEGNRRIACLKEIFNETSAEFAKVVPAYLLKEGSDTEKNIRLILSIRHVVGVKQWEPYQKALVIKEYKEKENKSTFEIAELLGLSQTEVMNSYRALNAFEQFCKETDNRDLSKFSYFVEAVSKPKVRDWLGTDDRGFCSNEERNLFYSWIVSEDGESPPIIPMAIDVRKLPKVLPDDDAYEMMVSGKGNVYDAVALVEATKVKWEPKLRSAIRTIESINIRNLTDEQIALIKEVKNAIDKLILDIENLTTRSISRSAKEVVSITKTCADSIISLLKTDFGKVPRSLSEIENALRDNAIFYSKQVISTTLMRLVRRGTLRRLRETEGYKYVLLKVD